MAGLEHGCLHELLPHINVVRSCRLGVWFTVHNHVDLGPRHGCFKSFGGPYDSSTLYNNTNYSRESNAKWGKLTRWEKLASLTRKRSLSSVSACVLIQVALLWYRYLTNWEAKNVLRRRQLETKSASIMTYSLNTHTHLTLSSMTVGKLYLNSADSTYCSPISTVIVISMKFH